jgi:DNA modification methylase
MKKSPDAPQRRVEYMPIELLEGAARNPKRHAGEEVQKSMGRFGYTEPLLLDERTQRLVAGHGRREALLSLKQAQKPPPDGVRVEGEQWLVPVMRGWASKNDQEAEAYLLASNRLTEAGGWHEDALAEMLQELHANDALEGLGFDDAFLAKLFDDAAPKPGKTDPDVLPPEPTGPLRVALGDVWVLGDHLITCGDCTSAEVVDRIIRPGEAKLCWTDPPWNVAYGENTNPAWSKKHAPIANDNLGDDFPEFCRGFTRQIARSLCPGALLYMAMSAQEWPAIHGALSSGGFHWSSTIIWAKDSLVLSRKDYHTQYEPIWYGWKDGAARLVPLEDRTQSDVWNIPRPKVSDEHPTMKPVELIVRSLRNSSQMGDVVFEPFSGSGSTLIACEQTGRRGRALELEPKYVQVAIERWEAFTGRAAVKG